MAFGGKDVDNIVNNQWQIVRGMLIIIW